MREFFDALIRWLISLPRWLAILLAAAVIGGATYGTVQAVSGDGGSSGGSGKASDGSQDVGTSDVGIDCRCPEVEAGLLTASYRRDCKETEDRLKSLARQGKLVLKADQDGTLVSGDFCHSVASGPGAWPRAGVSKTSPYLPDLNPD